MFGGKKNRANESSEQRGILDKRRWKMVDNGCQRSSATSEQPGELGGISATHGTHRTEPNVVRRLCKWSTLIYIYYWFSLFLCDFFYVFIFLSLRIWLRVKAQLRNLVSIYKISTMFEHSKRAFICKYWTRKKAQLYPDCVYVEKKWNRDRRDWRLKLRI